MSQEAAEIRQVQLQWEFDRKREKFMKVCYDEIERAWKTYKQKIERITIV
jgi:hypothetical protein